jgi:hypothetical protein
LSVATSAHASAYPIKPTDICEQQRNTLRMLDLVNSLKRYAVNIFILILLINNPNTLFGNAMFEFFVKHAVCNSSVWSLVNKRRVNTAC